MPDVISATWPPASPGSLVLPGPAAPTKPYTQNRVIVQIRRRWADVWVTDMALIPIRAEAHIRRAGESEFHFKRNYGPAEKQPYETAFSAVTPVDLLNWWVRVLLIGNDLKTPGAQGAQDEGEILFQGLVQDQTYNIGADDAGRMGVQGFKAVGPEMILRKTEIHQSRWLASDGTSFFTADWMPGFNIRSVHADEADDYVALEGNKSDLFRTDRNSFVFGGTEAWTNHDMLNYVLTFFVNQLSDDGTPAETAPYWTIGGQSDALETLAQRIPMPATISADELIQRIIPSAVGVEFKITPTAAGFEITIVSTVPDDGTFGGFTIPKNTDVWTADVGSDPLIAKYAVVVDSTRKKYDKIKVIGERCRVVFTFTPFGATVGDTSGRLKWTATEQADYLAAVSASDWDANAQYRTNPRLKNVFRTFGPPLENMANNVDYQAEMLGYAAGDGSGFPSVVTNYVQDTQRRTLAELPLQVGFDYSTYPPTDNTEPGSKAQFMRPFATVFSDETLKYHFVDRLKEVDEYSDAPNISVQPLKDDWGVHLNASPGHFMARDHWSSASPTPNPDGHNPEENTAINYSLLYITMAIETDYRIFTEQKLPTALQTGLGLTKILYAKDAHFWRMGGKVVVGINDDGEHVYGAAQTLRDDTPRLARSMAGAVAAYLNSAVNMVVEYKNLMPLNSRLGSIMRSVEDGGVDTNLWALVSSVSWNFETNETELSTGYALASA